MASPKISKSLSTKHTASKSNQDLSVQPVVHIVIIGAGIAGLTCARHLTKLLGKQPHNITVLEARDRVGGRTYSIPELNLDLGASWIFPHHTAALSLAHELNVNTMDQYESGTSLIDTGNRRIQHMVLDDIHHGAKRLQGGTGSLCAAMFNDLTKIYQKTVTIELNSPVRSVTYEANKTINVILQNNKSILCDYVVLALPPKLFVSTIRLTPAFSRLVTEELKSCATWMASTCKAILRYEHAWWKDKNLSGLAISHYGKAQEWHDASSDSCHALFVFCVAGTSKQEVIDTTVRVFGDEARNPTSVYMIDWSSEIFTSVSTNDNTGTHAHVSNLCREPHWNGRLWLGNSEVSSHHGGFIEGAIQRGTQVADRIAELITRK